MYKLGFIVSTEISFFYALSRQTHVNLVHQYWGYLFSKTKSRWFGKNYVSFYFSWSFNSSTWIVPRSHHYLTCRILSHHAWNSIWQENWLINQRFMYELILIQQMQTGPWNSFLEMKMLVSIFLMETQWCCKNLVQHCYLKECSLYNYSQTGYGYPNTSEKPNIFINPSHAAIKISINATAAEFICKNIFPIPVQIKKIIKNKTGDIQQIYLYQNVCK